MIRQCFVIILFMSTLAFCEDFDQTHTLFTKFLSANVSNGRVNYSAIKKSSSDLVSYIKNLESVKKSKFDSWSKDQQLAYLINLYNSETIKLIIDHYPVSSIKKIGSIISSPWDIKFINLWGDKVSLNFIEHGIIRKMYSEPRVHMALVCAAIGCPPLRSEAYSSEILGKQLDDQSKTYLKSSEGIVINKQQKSVKISKIFKWYGGDFSSVKKFVNKYTTVDISGYKIGYVDYNWNLNELVK